MQHTIWLFAYHMLFLELTSRNVTLYRNAISTPTFEGDGEIISLQAVNRLKKLGLSLGMLTNLFQYYTTTSTVLAVLLTLRQDGQTDQPYVTVQSTRSVRCPGNLYLRKLPDDIFENDSLLGLDCIFVDESHETVTPLTHVLHKPAFEVPFLIFHFC